MENCEDTLQILKQMFQVALNTAKPDECIPRNIPNIPHTGRTVVVGAGKAAASMAHTLEHHWSGTQPLEGCVVTRYGHTCPTQYIEVMEAAHPVPDSNSVKAAQKILNLVHSLTENDLCICLISGGGSSLLALPDGHVSLEDKVRINQNLLKSGANIEEMNCVRKHLSAIKGGKLAAAAFPAKIITLAISDVVGDDPATIASGPTVADPTNTGQALQVLDKYNIAIPSHIKQHLQSQTIETLKEGDSRLSRSEYHLIATPQHALLAAAQVASAHGYRILNLGDKIMGNAEAVARNHADMALDALERGEKLCILSGGETSVEVTGSGRGGRNSTYLLSLTKSLAGVQGIDAMACDTDGIDGSEDNAGAWTTPETWRKMQKAGMDPQDYLFRNDAYTFFKNLQQLVITGPTLTNINDFRAILVTPTT